MGEKLIDLFAVSIGLCVPEAELYTPVINHDPSLKLCRSSRRHGWFDPLKRLIEEG